MSDATRYSPVPARRQVPDDRPASSGPRAVSTDIRDIEAACDAVENIIRGGVHVDAAHRLSRYCRELLAALAARGDEVAELRRLNLGLAERVAAQSELLSKRAEAKT
jgi:hypothetical protein